MEYMHRNGGERSSVGYNQGPGQPSGHPGPGGSQGHPGGSQGHPGGNQGHPPPVTYPSHFPNSPHNQVSTDVNILVFLWWKLVRVIRHKKNRNIKSDTKIQPSEPAQPESEHGEG